MTSLTYRLDTGGTWQHSEGTTVFEGTAVSTVLNPATRWT